MKTLQESCLHAISNHLSHDSVGPDVCKLHRSLKTVVLEKVLTKNLLNASTWPYIVRTEFFENLTNLILPFNEILTDKFTSTVAASGCKLNYIFLVVPPIKHDERLVPLSGKGISALFANQDELEVLKLIWCINFKADVLTRIQSNSLKVVEIVGDAVCRCFEYNIVMNAKVDLYQRDLSVLAINNPTITKLCLDGIILDLNDCYTMLSALSDVLEHLEIKIVRFYAFCQRSHCFYGRDFVPFLELVDRTCHKLKYLSCFALQTDVQSRQLVMNSTTLETLSLEGHVFQMPLLLPPSVRKLKISVNGYEGDAHFAVIDERLEMLDKFYVKLVDDFIIVNEHGFQSMFSRLGKKLISLTNVNATNFSRISSLVCDFCPNLKELSVVRAQGAGYRLSGFTTGANILPLFQDPERAAKIRHLHLGLETLAQSLLICIAENCRELQTLDLAYCRTIDDAVLCRIAANCGTSLRVIELSLCSGITDAGIVAIAEKCSNLEEITMFQTKVGDEGVLALIQRCERLKFCNVNADQISPETLKMLTDNTIQTVV